MKQMAIPSKRTSFKKKRGRVKRRVGMSEKGMAGLLAASGFYIKH
jgi:hypothetical protein